MEDRGCMTTDGILGTVILGLPRVRGIPLLTSCQHLRKLSRTEGDGQGSRGTEIVWET